MAAEAPITAKKGEYSGLSSEDILALFSGRYSYKADCLIFYVFPFPTDSFGQVKTLRGGDNAAARKSTGVEKENGETEKVTWATISEGSIWVDMGVHDTKRAWNI